MSLAAGVVLLLATGATAATAEEKKGSLKVFVLAGQSNMEGQGKIAADPKSNGG